MPKQTATQTTSPLITIGITCFNAEDTIERAIRSASAQIWPNVEIVVVDDCSSDSSPEILERLAAKNPQARVFNHDTNRGAAAARNTILMQARGEFIALFDDDDESSPERLAMQYKRITDYEMRTGADLVVCHTARIQIFPDGTERYEPTMGTRAGAIAPNSLSVADQILIGRPMGQPIGSCATCSQMARKRLYASVGGFDEQLTRCDDTDLNVRLALAGGHFVGIAEPLVTQHMTISSDKRIDVERQNNLQVFDKYRDYLSKNSWYLHGREWLDIKYDYLAGNKLRFLMRMLLLFLRDPVRTGLRLYWTWPNRHHSRAALRWYRQQRTHENVG